MKKLFKSAAVGVMSLALAAPMLPAQNPYDGYRGGDHHQAASRHDGDRDYRGNSYNGDHDRYDRYRQDDRYRRDDRYGYQNRGYGYYDRDHHAGRDVAIVGGSAAAGALIGAAAGNGQGAVVGAIVGGIGGLIADGVVRHNDRRW